MTNDFSFYNVCDVCNSIRYVDLCRDCGRVGFTKKIGQDKTRRWEEKDFFTSSKYRQRIVHFKDGTQYVGPVEYDGGW